MIELTINTIITTSLGLIIGALATALKSALNKMKAKEVEENKQYDMLLKATRSLLHDCIYKECIHYTNTGSISATALKNLKYLYEPYAALGGNDIPFLASHHALSLDLICTVTRKNTQFILSERFGIAVPSHLLIVLPDQHIRGLKTVVVKERLIDADKPSVPVLPEHTVLRSVYDIVEKIFGHSHNNIYSTILSIQL